MFHKSVSAAAVAAAFLLVCSAAPAYQPDTAINYDNCAEPTPGTAGADTFTGTTGADSYDGGDGNDTLMGIGGTDCLFGGDGQDQVDGGSTGSLLVGGLGNDTIIGGSGSDDIDAMDYGPAGSGTDNVQGGGGDDNIKADDGLPDTITCGSGQDRVDADAVDSVGADCEQRVDLTISGDSPPGPDQSEPTGSEAVDDVPASATPVDGGGAPGLAPLAVSTETWGAVDVDNPSGLNVVNATASGTYALTGVVVDRATDSPIASASVTLTRCSTCTPIVTSTSATGAFAYVNVATSTAPTLAINASGYGTYTINNLVLSGDEEYQQTAALTSSAQTYDGAALAGAATLTNPGGPTNYRSNLRVPPDISVALTPQDSTCAAAGGSAPVRRYPWRFYVLHTMAGEIGGSGFTGGAFHQQAAKAVAAAIQNYAWYARRNGGGATGGADVDDTTAYQCFKPHKVVARSWRSWVDDVSDEEILTSAGAIQRTEYRAGTYSCTESAFPSNGDRLSQLGAKARDETCGASNWRDIDNYYYTGAVKGGAVPARPQKSYSRLSGAVQFGFTSTTNGSPSAWTYWIDRFDTPSNGWKTIYHPHWQYNIQAVPTSFVYHTTHTYLDRVRACNAAGCSKYVYFDDSAIAPG